jgi:sensor histidine kinase YesM
MSTEATSVSSVITTAPAPRHGLRRIFAPPRLIFIIVAAIALTMFLSLMWRSSTASLFLRVVSLTTLAVLVFGVFETRPRRLPRWVARWTLQIVGIVVALPIATFIIYMMSTDPGQGPFWKNGDRLGGFSVLSLMGFLLAPWAAVTVLFRQRDAELQRQALSFELEKSELERKAVDARLRLLQAQIEPHFLFNTLANVRQLVEVGSKQAPAVLDSLIDYLRAAVPRINEKATTLGHELQLVRAYLELMHLRMPDRLQYALHIDEAAEALRCPPMTLLTLVENAVRHGIDPAEDGGRIDISINVRGDRCLARVTDTGVGLAHAGRGSGVGLGTGLSSLRERLALAFGGNADLRIVESVPNGVCAEVEFPAERAV